MNVQQKSYSRAKADGTLDLLGDAGFLEAYAATAKLLGTCFAYSPKEEASMRALAAIRSMDVASDWPFDAEAEEGTTGETSMRAQAASLIEDGLERRRSFARAGISALIRRAGSFGGCPMGVGLFGSRQSALWLLVGRASRLDARAWCGRQIRRARSRRSNRAHSCVVRRSRIAKTRASS